MAGQARAPSAFARGCTAALPRGGGKRPPPPRASRTLVAATRPADAAAASKADLDAKALNTATRRKRYAQNLGKAELCTNGTRHADAVVQKAVGKLLPEIIYLGNNFNPTSSRVTERERRIDAAEKNWLALGSFWAPRRTRSTARRMESDGLRRSRGSTHPSTGFGRCPE